MPTFIGMRANDVAVFCSETGETKRFMIAGKWETKLAQLRQIVQPGSVAAMVVTTFAPQDYSSDFIAAARQQLGVERIEVCHQCVPELTRFVATQEITFSEGELVVIVVASNFFLWRFSHNWLLFQRTMKKTEIDASFKPRVLLAYEPSCLLNAKTMNSYIVPPNLSSIKTAETTLFRAKVLGGAQAGVIVQNFLYVGPLVTVGGQLVLNMKYEGVGLPYEWASEWMWLQQSTEAKLEIYFYTDSRIVPPGMMTRLMLSIDANCVPSFTIEYG